MKGFIERSLFLVSFYEATTRTLIYINSTVFILHCFTLVRILISYLYTINLNSWQILRNVNKDPLSTDLLYLVKYANYVIDLLPWVEITRALGAIALKML